MAVPSVLDALQTQGLLKGVPATALDRIRHAKVALRFVQLENATPWGVTTRAWVKSDPPVGCARVTFHNGTPPAWIIAHELGHVLDVLLANPGQQFRSESAQYHFKLCNVFVTARARVSATEWFAENFRAWCNIRREDEHPIIVRRSFVRAHAPYLASLFIAEGLY